MSRQATANAATECRCTCCRSARRREAIASAVADAMRIIDTDDPPGLVLLRLRDAMRMSRRELWEATGISDEIIHARETGLVVDPTIRLLRALVKTAGLRRNPPILEQK